MSKTTYETLSVILLVICLGCSSAYRVFGLRNYPEFEDRPTSNVTSKGSKHEVCPQTSYNFPDAAQITNYLRLQTPVPDLDEFTVCGWYTPSTSTEDTWFSYANHKSAYAFSIRMRYSFIGIYMNGRYLQESVSLSTNREYHICFATFAGSSAHSYMFIDGQLGDVYHGSPGIIAGGGLFIMGQLQRAYGGNFHTNYCAQGKMSNFMIWDRVLTFDEIGKMSKNRCFCPPNYLFTAENRNMDMFGAVSALPTKTCPHK